MSATQEFKIKCRACGLHYIVLSWDENWDKEQNGGFCPECGTKGAKIVWGPVARDEQIFQLVPGDAPISAMS